MEIKNKKSFLILDSCYTFTLFTLRRYSKCSLTLLADLLSFHLSADYIFIQRLFSLGATFFFRLKLAALLSLKEIVVGGFPCLKFKFRTFPAKHPL